MIPRHHCTLHLRHAFSTFVLCWLKAFVFFISATEMSKFSYFVFLTPPPPPPLWQSRSFLYNIYIKMPFWIKVISQYFRLYLNNVVVGAQSCHRLANHANTFVSTDTCSLDVKLLFLLLHLWLIRLRIPFFCEWNSLRRRCACGCLSLPSFLPFPACLPQRKTFGLDLVRIALTKWSSLHVANSATPKRKCIIPPAWKLGAVAVGKRP